MVPKDLTFVLMDIDSQKLEESEARNKSLIADTNSSLKLEFTIDRCVAPEGAHFYLVTCGCNLRGRQARLMITCLLAYCYQIRLAHIQGTAH